MASSIVSGQAYWFYNWSSNTTIDLDGGRSGDETPVQGWQAHWDEGSNQTWIAEDRGDGYFTLTNAASKTVMDLYGGSSKRETPIIGYHFHGGDNQLWKFTQISSKGEAPSFRIINKQSDTAVDLLNGGSSNGTKIVGWVHGSGNSNSHQRWIAVPASAGSQPH